jgi:hypothetical protein
MHLGKTAALTTILVSTASPALAQKFTGIVEHQTIEIFNETVVRMGGGISGLPTPEQEAFGFEPGKILKMPSQEVLKAASEAGGKYELAVTTIYVSDFAMRADLQSPIDAEDMISHVVRHMQGVAFIFLHREKKYVEMKVEPPSPRHGTLEKSSIRPREDDQTVFRKTGERAVINGVECERYFAKDALGMREAWVSFGFGELRKALDRLHDQMTEAAGRNAALDELWQGFPSGLPILFKQLTAGGSLGIEEIKSLKRRQVDAKLFEVPSGYKKIGLTDLAKMRMEE